MLVQVTRTKAINSDIVLMMCKDHHLSRKADQLTGKLLDVHVITILSIGLLPNADIKMQAIKNNAAMSKVMKTPLSFLCRKADMIVVTIAMMTKDVINTLNERIVFCCCSK